MSSQQNRRNYAPSALDSIGTYSNVEMRRWRLMMTKIMEHELLLCCARTSAAPEVVARLRELAATKVDWEYLFLLARRHAVVPLLYLQLEQTRLRSRTSREPSQSKATLSRKLRTQHSAHRRTLPADQFVRRRRHRSDPLQRSGPALFSLTTTSRCVASSIST